MTMVDEGVGESIMKEDTPAVEADCMNLYKDFPSFSNTFYKKLKETFDVRKMCRYTDKIEYLRGVQDVLDFLDNVRRYKDE